MVYLEIANSEIPQLYSILLTKPESTSKAPHYRDSL